MHILFVCTGNICRSPTAERLAVAEGARQRIPNLVVSSAGTRAVIAHPVHREAAVILERLGGDASAFAARQLTPRIASDADLIVTMSRDHRDAVLELAPHKLQRTFTMAEVAELASEFRACTLSSLVELRPQLAGRRLPDIADPIGQEAAVFAEVGSKIAAVIPAIVELSRRHT